MKKILIFILIIILTGNTYVYADDHIEEKQSEKEILDILQTSSIVEDTVSINSRAAVVIERSTNKVLYGKKEQEKRPMASTTKIMTRTNCIRKFKFRRDC